MDPSRMDTCFISPVKDNNFHPKLNLLVKSPDSGIPQSPPHALFSFQPESPVLTNQPTNPSPLPRSFSFIPNNFHSTSTGTTPRSRNTRTSQSVPREWYGKPYF